MPRSAATSVENNFSRGLITEATAMNYPENSVVETDNCVYLKNGTVLRRNGVDFEDNNATYTFEELGVLSDSLTPDYNDVAIKEFEWVTLNDGANKSFLVSQIGDVLRFFEIDNSNVISPNLKDFSVKVSDYRTTPEFATDAANVTGTVVVTNPLVASLSGTLEVSNSNGLFTITFGPGVGQVDSVADLNAALADLSVALNMIAEINDDGYLRFSSPAYSLESFIVDGTINTFTAFGIVEQDYLPSTEEAFEAVARRECSFSTGLGYLFVVHPLCEPFFIEYNMSIDDIVVERIDIQTRDFERLNDSLLIDERTSSYTEPHFYNLYNQGWYARDITAADDNNYNALNYWVSSKGGIFPSNSDVWWMWKNSEGKFQPTQNTFAQLAAPAANGHYIYSAFQTDRRSATGTLLTSLPERSSGPYRPSSTTFFSSRVWYSGVNIEGFSSNVYFSKLIEGKRDFGTCYQAQDPTAEDFNDLLETDGGVIVIPEAIRITGLVPIGRNLIVFASSGIWAISGTQGGFKANDYAIRKISASPVTSPTSIVVAEDRPFWWSRSGIYTMIVDQNSGELAVENISDITIKKMILKVPAANIEFIKGVYNTVDRTIQWLYRLTTATETIYNYQYSNILVHDTTSKAFYVHTISPGVPRISGSLSSSKSTFDSLSVDDGGSTTAYITTGDFGPFGAKSITISKFKDTLFNDWGVTSFTSYFITGYRVRAELLRKFQANYLVVISKLDGGPEEFEDHSVLISGVWDYEETVNGRTTIPQQVYKWSYNKDYSRRKLKIRGNGYSLQYKFSSQPNKKFILTGWVSSETASNAP